jgi:5-methylcytosine-specific restriction endonuclease McrA
MKKRDIIYNKYGGLCAYTGKPLGEDWQIDHITPRRCHWKLNGNHINNLVPANRIINHYKRSLDLEGFREYMTNFHKRLAKLPKNTTVPATERRIEYMNEVARHFDITVDKPFNGIFYFEACE